MPQSVNSRPIIGSSRSDIAPPRVTVIEEITASKVGSCILLTTFCAIFIYAAFRRRRRIERFSVTM